MCVAAHTQRDGDVRLQTWADAATSVRDILINTAAILKTENVVHPVLYITPRGDI